MCDGSRAGRQYRGDTAPPFSDRAGRNAPPEEQEEDDEGRRERLRELVGRHERADEHADALAAESDEPEEDQEHDEIVEAGVQAGDPVDDHPVREADGDAGGQVAQEFSDWVTDRPTE